MYKAVVLVCGSVFTRRCASELNRAVCCVWLSVIQHDCRARQCDATIITATDLSFPVRHPHTLSLRGKKNMKWQTSVEENQHVVMTCQL